MTEKVHAQGTVTRTFPRKGYFWIEGHDGVDYFGHVSQVQNPDLMTEVYLESAAHPRPAFNPQYMDGPTDTQMRFLTPRIGQRCQFDAVTNDKGPAAEFIVLE